ncbi:hypothetical protein A2716_03165 [candidate division WWE3 bacterium RIFCSPHIGHO2_01_FULL_40_23]|uniref:Uncharacterized protein n=1 Tax=candidate division WWE3 bacterium RIFCSPLOWO2_01_FULL_41_18 TaxID=1802625 RepID=A0A1F4VCJ5_UNCKA|nr:MAG: hypothetical protein A2716_03165 [candidate division WWE3 bacterium RIFCSPHIGHO2_01_FULL_40_23]OGC54884.1 MAG: hypothetical protein A3A78_02775 [candidate division WWE3 bacterium RIFCSPLOWO2_01_FULL_41_18]
MVTLISQYTNKNQGTAKLTDIGNGKTKVVIQLDIMAGQPPANIYSGSCVKIGAVKYTLMEVRNGLKTNSAPGKSKTILNTSLQELHSMLPLAIGVRNLPLSATPSLEYCGNLK